MADYVEISTLRTIFDADVQFGLQNVQLFTSRKLEITTGSFGYICTAKCDSLTCVAKILSLENYKRKLPEPGTDPESVYMNIPETVNSSLKKQCQMLASIRHPNIVQYLGVHEDPMRGLALLMEQMDDNLTHFLESMPNPLPYYTEVDFCSDIAQALSFLHTNGIVHGNLTSNNVLLVRNFRLKVTDFGMAELFHINQPSPMALVFMPPEAFRDIPILSENGDCFSFGVLVVQILTKKYPKPSSRQQPPQRSTSGQSKAVAIGKAIPEINRRQNHIKEIHPTHPLLGIALNCLKDERTARTCATDLCTRLSALKQTPLYIESEEKYNSSQLYFTAHDPSITEKAVKVEIDKLNKQHTLETRKIKADLASSRELVRILSPGYIQQASEWTKTWEIDRNQISLMERIETGKFGDSVVCRGLWNGVIPIAVKTSMCEPVRGSVYLHEASIMKNFCHPNLLRLLGVCTKEESIFVVTKLMGNGNLLHYLQSRDVQPRDKVLIQLGAQIANGMAYLTSRKYIHRAVCAENILLDDRLNCKVSNFQHAQELCNMTDSINLPSNSHLPVRWTATETIMHNKFCIKSDVWAFGILLYEIMARGETPYVGIKVDEVFSKVLSGYRIPHSDVTNCPQKLYTIMVDCWNEDPTSRPTFETLQWMLDDYYYT